ncbi:hypothetical protein GCK32_007637 [Trichostrongylus colubriformis]|uniref:Uncharacterized protein n=1 Tax=Trichostrongylus colubriformis TaxID=6319 RepID=A0AAN8IGD3_TRICO
MSTSDDVKDVKDEEAPSAVRPNLVNGLALNTYNDPPNGFFTSTPYLGYGYTHLPPITSVYSPFARYYGATESSTKFIMDPSSSSSLDSAMESRLDQQSPPPRLVPIGKSSVYNSNNLCYSGNPFTSSLQSDSGISSSSSSGTPITRNTVRGYKKTYCSICKMHINKDGKRSQGPRRHLLQYHVRRPLFQCPHCSHSSFYDKFHVTSHMRRIHQDTSERLINRSSEFEDEVEEWYERCFDDRKNGNEKRQSSQKPPSPSQSDFSPPPVLTPEILDQENVDPVREALTCTPLKAPLKRRKMGFMIDDILQPSPPKQIVTQLQTNELDF